ncbi:MAG: DNA-directed RNA polymerase subunit beta'', partial [Firmicutes bacterium]|nr:DNA-directed RNA polymerase subunit beta'' [Bacillota bacterium]
MLSAHNILSPAHGRPVATPTQDMVIGCYYLTMVRPGARGEGKLFTSSDEVQMAYDAGVLELHAQIKVRFKGQLLETTPGRLFFNEAIPVDLGYMNEVVDKKKLGKIVELCYRKFGNAGTAQVLDAIKRIGFRFATRSGTTISVTDITIPPQKKDILGKAEEEVGLVEQQHRRGLITPEERYRRICDIWTQAKDDVTKAMLDNLDRFNPVYMMATSGARGNVSQLSQLAGMRGLMADPSGRIIEIPIKANFREGLTVLEYFTSTHGTRKGLADTALRTADSGYLTRRLVDVAQDVIVREHDCGTHEGIMVGAIKEGNEVIESLRERLAGRVAAEQVVDPATGEVIVEADEMITEDRAEAIEKAGVEEVNIRSVLTCHSRYGVCMKCYGRNLATGRQVEVGEAVGIIAAQSIGEPGTQLTMRTFHTGGVAGDDITQGLPRVEELFEARKPKGQAIISEVDGVVHISEVKGTRRAGIRMADGEEKSYQVPYGARLRVKDGQQVVAGDRLTEGSVNPHDILRISGMRGVQMYLVHEVQDVYRSQGVDINDKHIEVIVRQMLRKVKVETSGDTELLPGGLVDIFEFLEENERVKQEDGEPAVGRPVLLGITKASLATDSFLSAASFQETTRVLTEASIKGKMDLLIGLKENVIIGKLIPAGTGMSRYRNIQVHAEEPAVKEEQPAEVLTVSATS